MPLLELATKFVYVSKNNRSSSGGGGADGNSGGTGSSSSKGDEGVDESHAEKAKESDTHTLLQQQLAP